MYLPSSCLANCVKRAEHMTRSKWLSCFWHYEHSQRWKSCSAWWINSTCAQVWNLRDLFLLVNQLIERTEDTQELLHLVRHGHALQDLRIQYRNKFCFKLKERFDFKMLVFLFNKTVMSTGTLSKKTYQFHFINIGGHCFFFWHISKRIPCIPK